MSGDSAGLRRSGRGDAPSCLAMLRTLKEARREPVVMYDRW